MLCSLKFFLYGFNHIVTMVGKTGSSHSPSHLLTSVQAKLSIWIWKCWHQWPSNRHKGVAAIGPYKYPFNHAQGPPPSLFYRFYLYAWFTFPFTILLLTFADWLLWVQTSHLSWSVSSPLFSANSYFSTATQQWFLFLFLETINLSRSKGPSMYMQCKLAPCHWPVTTRTCVWWSLKHIVRNTGL